MQSKKFKRNMERRLFDAAFKDNVGTLHELVQEDELILHRVSLTSSNYTPLHIAAKRGNLSFVKEILIRNPELVSELDSRQKWTALHVASAQGHLEIVQALLDVDPDVCWMTDRDGRNPLHIAAIKGRVEILMELVHARPHAAREKTKRGDPLLHLCAKYNQLGALKKVAETIDDGEFLNEKNGDGQTALHLAVILKQIEVIKYLLQRKINVNARNTNGHTALDILAENIAERHEIENSLLQAGALRTSVIDHVTPNPQSHTTPLASTRGANFLSHFTDGKWLEQKSKTIMVVASLIATMAFQAAVSPAGGVWQDDSTDNSNPHTAGESVMAYHHLKYYKNFLRSNTLAFVSSLCTILLLISGLPFKSNFFTGILVFVMILTATSITISYVISIAVVTPKSDWEQLGHVVEVIISVWSTLIILIFLGKSFYWMKLHKKTNWRRRRSGNSAVGRHGNVHGYQVSIPISSS